MPASMRRTARAGLVGAVAAGVSFLLVVAGAAPADAAFNPGGPQYTYRMVSVTQTSDNAKAESLSPVFCNRTSNNGSASYSDSTTSTNSFSFTGGLDFGPLKDLLTGKANVTITSSTTLTTTSGGAVGLKAGQCAQVFALRDRFAYTLQRACHYACQASDSDHAYHSMGKGTYSKVIGRAFYLV